MSGKRARIAKIRKMIIEGAEVDVPRYVHRHLGSKGWSVSFGGVKKYFGDAGYGSWQGSLREAKLFLGQTVVANPDFLLQHAQIKVRAECPKDGRSLVTVYFKDYCTGKDMNFYLGIVKTDVDFWPYVDYAFQELPAWLTGLDYQQVKEAWLKMHKVHTANVYHNDDFKKFLEGVVCQERQLSLVL